MSKRRSSYSRSSSSGGGEGCVALTGCGCWIAVIVFNILLGMWSVNYCLMSIFGKSVDGFVAFIAGLFLAELTVPLAIICWLLRCAGVETPFLK